MRTRSNSRLSCLHICSGFAQESILQLFSSSKPLQASSHTCELTLKYCMFLPAAPQAIQRSPSSAIGNLAGIGCFCFSATSSSSRSTLKSRQVAAKLIAHSTGSRVIAFKSHTVWYGARPTDRTTRGPITVSRSLLPSLEFSVEAPLLCTSHSIHSPISTIACRLATIELHCTFTVIRLSPIERTPGPAC